MTKKNRSWHEYEKAFGFLAVILNHSPNADIVRQLRDMSSSPENMISDEEMQIGNIGNKTMSAYWYQHQETPLEDIVKELAVDWTRLFRGLSPAFGPPPPYEGVYCEKDGIGTNIILEVNQEYLEYGLSVSEEGHDRSDYLGYELDFIRYLAEQAAAAREEGRTEEEERCRTSMFGFIQKHLSWVGDFCGKAADYANTDVYTGFLELLEGTVAEAAADCLYRGGGR